MNVVQMKCPKCSWEGDESQLIEEPADLRLNDKFSSAIFVMAIKRFAFLCPKCRTQLLEKKYMYGMEMETEKV
jgi:hypothetical protein